MPLRFITKQYWALGLIAVCCIGIILGSLGLVNGLLQANRMVSHTLSVMNETEQSLLCLIDCETAYRGYLVTIDKRFLEPFITCEGHVIGHLDKVQELTSDNSRQQVRIARLIQLAKEKISFSKKAIERRDQYPNAKAKDIVDLLQGKTVMDEFRSIIAKVLDEEQQLYQQRVQSQRELQSATYCAVALLGLLICGAIYWISWSSTKWAREQAEAQALLSDARDTAIRANELKSQFVANISHEIRTPLSGVLGMSELLTRSEPDKEKRELIEHIFKSAQNLLFIVNDLLDFSKLEAGRITLDARDFSVNDIVNDVIQTVQVSAESKQITITTHIASELLKKQYSGDPDRLRQILLNMVHNAVKFASEGTIIVSVEEEAKNDGAVLRFEVKDSGIGLSKEDSTRLFQPFVQADGSTSRKFGGTGLGLSISKKLVELMDGQIGCDSKGLGTGSTFWFSVPLPVSAPKPARAEQPG